MNIQEQIKKYITSQPEPKRSDMQALHRIILQVMPACKLWFLDGKNSENKTVSNPNIGYGFHTIKYADGKTREFYQIGMIADEELHHYFTDLLRAVDTILFGRKTYQLMFPCWHTVAENQSETKAANEFARTIDAINKVVFSKTPKSVESKNTTISRAKIEEELLKLKGQPGKDIFIDGLSVASHLIRLGMVDEYYFVVHPVVAGRGPPLFEADGLKERLQLELVESKEFSSGVIALHYKKTAT